MAQLEDAVRTWWQTVGPANNLPSQFWRLVDPEGPPALANGQLPDVPGPVGLGAGASRADIRLGKDRTQVERAVRMHDNLWKAAFTDYSLEPPRPQTELVAKHGGTVDAVKWTPELTRPKTAPTEPQEMGQPSDNVEGGPPLIWTREPSPASGPLR